MNPKEQYLFLYLKTGGGHLAPAKAVSGWINQKNQKDISIELHDGFLGASPIIRGLIEDGYQHSQSKGKWTFELLYAIHKFRPIARISSWLVSLFVVPALERKILTLKPTKIIIFHFFLIKPVLKIIGKHNLTIPVLTVVTDPFTAHPIWFLERNQHFIVFSNRLKKHMETVERIESKRISVFPFTINPRFSQPASIQQQLAIRCHLGIELSSKVILLMGGADGIPRGEKLLKNFAQSHIDADVVIVCGRNNSLKRKALRVKRKYGFNRLHVLGFVDFVYELLSISDVVITKCGASTFMEVLLCGKIPLVNSYIWEQEKGNVDFIRQNGMGIFEPNTQRIAQLAGMLVQDSTLKESFKHNIDRMELQNGTPHVSDFISNYKNNSNESACNIRLTY